MGCFAVRYYLDNERVESEFRVKEDFVGFSFDVDKGKGTKSNIFLFLKYVTIY